MNLSLLARLLVLAGALLALALCFAPTVAEARAGGGQSYSGSSYSGSSYSGSSSSRSYSSSSSYSGSSGRSSSSDGDLIFFLIWLCFEHPVIGIPLTIVIGVIWLFGKSSGGWDA